MLFPKHLTTLIIVPNVIGGMLLPIILVAMLRLVNNRRLMGGYVNGPAMNAIAWLTAVGLIVLYVVLVIGFVFGL